MRYDTINQVIQNVGAKSYLEIGFQRGINFALIDCKNKLAVDPNPSSHHPSCLVLDSDSFFETNDQKFDVIFIDGLHVYEQVKRDFENSVQALNKGGAICLHDMSPKNSEYARSFADGGQWNGDCYKLVVDLYAGIYKYKYYTGSVIDDHGVTVVFPDQIEEREVKPVDHSFEWFDNNRVAVLKEAK